VIGQPVNELRTMMARISASRSCMLNRVVGAQGDHCSKCASWHRTDVLHHEGMAAVVRTRTWTCRRNSSDGTVLERGVAAPRRASMAAVADRKEDDCELNAI
jgi:hypothetical protein